MIGVTLTMHYTATVQREAAAWLVPGGPREWIKEILGWQVPQADLRLYVMPRAVGLLVVLPQGCRPRAVGRARAFGCLAGRLFLPVEAVLQPQVAERELQDLLGQDLQACVLHPVTGLVGFSADEQLRLSDLFERAAPRDVDWTRAEAGVAINGRLVSVEPDDPPTIESVLDQARDDIGSQPTSLVELPSSPTEPSSGALSNLGRGIQRGLARATLWFTRGVPRTAGAPTWINSLESWAQSTLDRVHSALSDIRDRELLRLMHLLDHNPDQGLRYAIPLTGDPHRGRAPPSDRLGQRDVDFSLGGLGGGHAADVWHVSWERRQHLLTRYRALADREIRLGRHRRAAYIFGQLLHDLNSAAAVLADGGHAREAAVLFRDRLHRPREAARCLEAGGLLSEAVSLYEELGDFERVGDIYTRLGRRDDASWAYRRAVEMQAAAGDVLSAARLLEEKLEVPEEALAMLDTGWPHSSQAGRCLEEVFELLARHGLHAAARRRAVHLKQESVPAHRSLAAAEALASASRTFPHDGVRQEAADACRVVVAQRLPDAIEQERQQLVLTLGRLVPQDRLLERDCNRFLRRSPGRQRAAAVRRSPKHPGLVHEFSLPQDILWTRLLAVRETFFAAGFRGSDLVLVRCRWDGRIQQPKRRPWRVRDPEVPILLASDPRGIRRIYLHSLWDQPLSYERVFPATDSFPRELNVVSPPGATPRLVAMAQTTSILWLVRLQPDQSFDVVGYSESGKLLTTRSVMAPVPRGFVAPPLLLPRSNTLQLAMGRRLLSLGPGGQVDQEEFPSEICDLTASAPHSRPRVAVTFDHGGLVMWGGYDLRHREAFAAEMHRPHVEFTRSGALVAADDSACEIYDTKSRRVELVGSLDPPKGQLLDVLAPPYSKQFALCTRAGKVRIYELP